MLLRFIPGRILYVTVGAPMITCRASALLPSGFSRAHLYWCRKISQRRILTGLASRRSRSRPAHVCKWCPCPWIGQEIRLQDSINPDFPPLLNISLMNNNEALFQLPHAPVGGKVLRTTSNTTGYCRLGYMWPFPWWRSAVYYLKLLVYGAKRCAGGLGSQFLFQRLQFCWMEVPFRNISVRVERFWHPRPLTSMTMEGLLDCRKHFARWHYATSIARFYLGNSWSPSWEHHEIHTSLERVRCRSLPRWGHTKPRKSCRTRSLDRESSLDTDSERQCTCLMQNWTTCLAQQETCVISQCRHWWRGTSLGKWGWIWKQILWVLVNHFPNMRGKPETSPARRYFAICSTSSWWHQLDYWKDRVWRPPCFKEGLGSRPWRNSLQGLQVCWLPGFEVPL